MNDIGYGKPPVATQFRPGESGNPGGKTSEQRKLEVENAERATRLRSRMLIGLERELEKAEAERDILDAKDGDTADADAAIGMITTTILKLLKDAEDRGLGTPIQSVNVESPNRTISTTGGKSALYILNSRLEKLSNAELEQLEGLTDKMDDRSQ